MEISPLQLKETVEQLQPELIAFAQKLIQTPGLSGEEGAVAGLVQAEMNRLGYDEVSVDAYGNVIGWVKGASGPALMLNGHMDHVDPGPTEGWLYPPFSGQIVDGELWGRGAVDMKGPLACMIYAPAVLKRLGLTPPGDLYVVSAVMEEHGGIGSFYLTTHLKTDLAIVGEPSRNILRRGHRGRVELQVIFHGQSVHASVPHLGANPHFSLARFVAQLPALKMTADDLFGGANVAPTLIHSDQISPNVTPSRLVLTLDWRNVPAETLETILRQVDALLQTCLEPGITAEVQPATYRFSTYTGVSMEHPAIFPSFLRAETDPFVQRAHQIISRALSRTDPVGVWPFATDGGYISAAGIPTLGFGPGDETLAHTNRERISLHAMAEATVGYAALALTDWALT